MTVAIRRAEPRDIPDLARVLLEAAGGMYEALYEGAIPGRPTNQIMEHVLSRPNVTTAIANCWVVEVDGRFAGGVNSYPADAASDDPPDPLISDDRLGILEPFDHLHREGSYYIASLAAYPEFRKHGVGRLLMAEAEGHARSKGFTEASLHVFKQNSAVGFYERLGYREVARHPVVPHPRITYDGDMLLMTKRL